MNFPHKYIYTLNVPLREVVDMKFDSIKELINYLLNDLEFNYKRETLQRRIYKIKNISVTRTLNENYKDQLIDYHSQKVKEYRAKKYKEADKTPRTYKYKKQENLRRICKKGVAQTIDSNPETLSD